MVERSCTAIGGLILGLKHDGNSAVAPGRPGSVVFPDSPLGEDIEGIPTGRDVEWEPLVDYRRNGVSEKANSLAVFQSQVGDFFRLGGGTDDGESQTIGEIIVVNQFLYDADRQKIVWSFRNR